MNNNRIVLITGVSSGIGQAIALHLTQIGYTVFGTSRKTGDKETLSGVTMVSLDVNSDTSVQLCVDTVIQKAGRIDVLINNAGYVLAGALEEVTIEQAKAQFETNLFGVMRMVKAVLPVMRRQGGGQIINMSSLAGLVPVIFWGMYTASKFAIEGYTETLRHEIKPFGINVSLVEPGFIRTSITDNATHAADTIEDYTPCRIRGLQAIYDREDHAPAPSIVARCVQRILETDAPSLRYQVGVGAGFMALGRRLLPERIAAWFIRRYFRLDR